MINPPPRWLLQWSEVIAGIGTVVLTIILVTLYKRQQEQLAANHAAILEVSEVEWSRDTGRFLISNFGNGAVRNISLSTLIEVDTGAHRKYILRRNRMKREDKSGEWSSVIQPGEEEIPFEGKSKVGKMAPIGIPKNWMSIKFSDFIREMKDKSATEVKYLHVVHGWEMSDKSHKQSVYLSSRGLNPQHFEREHSLENLPGLVEYSNKEPFIPYFYLSNIRKISNWIHIQSIDY